MHENARLIQQGFDAFGAGDLAAIAALFTDDITWHHTGHGPLAGDYHGQGEVFDYFGRLLTLTQGTFHQSIHTILADDEHVVVLTDMGFAQPQSFAGNDVFVFHMRGNQTSECWAISADQEGSAAALS